jgi:protein-S-isoprenylcysteine O-methyltransferase Ste14
MYAGSFPILIGTPLALGSWWGLLTLIVFVPTLSRNLGANRWKQRKRCAEVSAARDVPARDRLSLIWRLVDEESFLRKNLPGYTEYTDKVQYHLVPYVW